MHASRSCSRVATRGRAASVVVARRRVRCRRRFGRAPARPFSVCTSTTSSAISTRPTPPLSTTRSSAGASSNGIRPTRTQPISSSRSISRRDRGAHGSPSSAARVAGSTISSRNVAVLASPRFADRRRRRVARRGSRTWSWRRRSSARAVITAPAGSLVTLLPAGGDVLGITTNGPAVPAARRRPSGGNEPRHQQRARRRHRRVGHLRPGTLLIIQPRRCVVKRALLVLVAAATLGLAACGSSSKPAATTSSTQPAGSTVPGKPKITTVVLLTHARSQRRRACSPTSPSRPATRSSSCSRATRASMVNEAILRKNNPRGRRVVRRRQHVPHARARCRHLRPVLAARPRHGASGRLRSIRSTGDADRRERRVCRSTTRRGSATTAGRRRRRTLDDRDRPALQEPHRRRERVDVVARARVPARDRRREGRERLAGLLDARCKAQRRARRRRLDGGLRDRLHRRRRQRRSADRRFVRFRSRGRRRGLESAPRHAEGRRRRVDRVSGRWSSRACCTARTTCRARRRSSTFMLTREFQEDMPLQMYVNPVVTGAALPAVFTKWAVDPAASVLDRSRDDLAPKRNDVDQGVDRSRGGVMPRRRSRRAGRDAARRSSRVFFVVAARRRSSVAVAALRRDRRRLHATVVAARRVVHVLAGRRVDGADARGRDCPPRTSSRVTTFRGGERFARS